MIVFPSFNSEIFFYSPHVLTFSFAPQTFRSRNRHKRVTCDLGYSSFFEIIVERSIPRIVIPQKKRKICVRDISTYFQYKPNKWISNCHILRFGSVVRVVLRRRYTYANSLVFVRFRCIFLNNVLINGICGRIVAK